MKEPTLVYVWEICSSTEYSQKGLRAKHMNKLWPCQNYRTVHGYTIHQRGSKGPIERCSCYLKWWETAKCLIHHWRDESGAELRALSDSSVTSTEKGTGWIWRGCSVSLCGMSVSTLLPLPVKLQTLTFLFCFVLFCPLLLPVLLHHSTFFLSLLVSL